MKKLTISFCLVLAFSQMMFGGAISMDTWYGFVWTPVQGAAVGSEANPGEMPWTIEVGSTAYLVVVDGYMSGDRFEAFDNSISLGATTVVGSTTTGCEVPLTCLANAGYSSGIWALAPGSHSISIGILADPHEGGGAYFGVLSEDPSAVPEPATFALVGMGAALAVLRARRRRQAR
jgi:hypothetical protein